MELIFFFPDYTNLKAINADGAPPPIGTPVFFHNLDCKDGEERDYNWDQHRFEVESLAYSISTFNGMDSLIKGLPPNKCHCEVHLRVSSFERSRLWQRRCPLVLDAD